LQHFINLPELTLHFAQTPFCDIFYVLHVSMFVEASAMNKQVKTAKLNTSHQAQSEEATVSVGSPLPGRKFDIAM